MTSPTEGQQVLLQQLRASLETTQLGQSMQWAAELARQGALPIVELFSVCQQLTAGQRGDQALVLYQLWLQHTASPAAYAVLFNYGVSLSDAKDEAGAEAAYRRALELNPRFIEAHMNLATLLERKGLLPDALALWNNVTAIADPATPADRLFHIQALNNLGRLLEIRRQMPEAEEMLTRSVLLDPDQPKVLTHIVHLRQKQCRWPVFAPLPGVSSEALFATTSALAMLSASHDPAEQLAASRRFVEEKVMPLAAQPLAPSSGYRHERLRVGFLSSDLCSHAVSILTAELYELLDRARFEVYAFSWSREDGTPLRARVRKAMDHYIPITHLDDEEAARCIRDCEIDILIDLHGLTLGTRPDILSRRPAPVQITYLGFPGPTALPGVDYVIADKFVLPEELARHFTERPLYMPHCFQINDRQREIGPRPDRAACGLPQDAFVFCSFNNNFKITEEVFASWMRILARVPQGVLWLVSDHEVVRQNLRAAAQAQGVDPARLYFAERAAPADYLARFQCADLFLDTAPFNAGTTASDALWAGLPLLTCAGATFSSRMAGSLLLAVDLPELITTTPQQYEELAVALAAAPQRVADMKRHLRETRHSCALFDSPRFVRELETLLADIALRAQGEPDAPLPQAPRAPLPPPLPVGGDPNIGIFCVTHVEPLIRFPDHVKVIHLGNYQQDGALNLRDLAPEWDVFHPLLGGTAGSFAIRNYLRAHPEIKHVAMCSYRKFMTRTRIGVPVPNFPQQHAVSMEQMAGADMAQLMDYRGIDFLVSDPLYFKRWGYDNVMHQYQAAHRLEDLMRFLSEAISEHILTADDVYQLLHEELMIPGGAEFGLYPAHFFIYAVDRLEHITAAYLRKFRVIHEGYQIRSISFICERVGSYLLLKYLRQLYPQGIPDDFWGNFNIVNH